MDYRIERDTMGAVQVPKDKYWGAQTQRSLENFKIGWEKMPVEIIDAFAVLKKSAAVANYELELLDQTRMELIVQVCDDILQGNLKEHFPLAVWQTGSGTQSNMNVNEVIANKANEIAGENIIHPNDHVNKSQSSNDTFPTAMHIAAKAAIHNQLLPAIDKLYQTFKRLSKEYQDIIKIGRTHLQDATPLTLGQEISGWQEMLKKCKQMILMASEQLNELAIGGTAVGTGLNAPKEFGSITASEISHIMQMDFVSAPNKFHSLTSKDGLVFVHGAVKALAADLMKIANDIRLLASGPRCGIGELQIPENEPGSSIMPGKVNPTQCEALTMVAVQVMANDVAIGMAASQGNFQLNVYMPVCIYNFLQSVRLLSDAIHSFHDHCAVGIQPNKEKIKAYLEQSLMLVTALNPHIGYEKAAQVAKTAHQNNCSLKEAALALGILSSQEFDRIVRPELMTKPLK